MKVPFSKPFEMTASLPLDEVVTRLRAALYGQPINIGGLRKSPVVGFIRSRSCVIHLRQGVFKNKLNYLRVLDLQFIEVPEGILLRGKFRFSWAFWFGIVASILVLIALISQGGRLWIEQTGLVWYVPYLWVVLMVFSSVSPIWWSRGAETKLELFIREALAQSE